jgi:acetoin utilization protein AcuB
MGIIRRHKIRHFPIVEAGRLVGIVADRDPRAASHSSDKSLETHDLHYLLEKVRVCDMMASRTTISPVPAE